MGANQIILNIQEDHTFTMYDQSEPINKGTYESCGRNEFLFKGEKFPFKLIANSFAYDDVRKKIGNNQITYTLISEESTIF